MEDKSSTGYEAIIPGGGLMGELIRAYDWLQTPLGAIEDWSPSLKTAVSLMLNSRYPMFIWWGEENINFYNDAYIPILGARHPTALGISARDLWAEAWDLISSQREGVFKQGQASWDKDFLLILKRNGYKEETYFTFSYSPIYENESIAGLFCTCTEDTRRVLSDRRIKTLRELAEETVKAKTAEEAGEIAIETLGNNLHDLPFTLLYMLEETDKARLIATARLEKETPISPLKIELSTVDRDLCSDADFAPLPPKFGGEHIDDLWSLQNVLQSGESHIIQLDRSKYGQMPDGIWSEPAKLAVVLPINTSERVSGFLIAGVSPVREFDDDYQGFFDLVAGQIATAIANARAYEAEKQRAEALAAIDRAKTAFFSNVSHEFRTPLTLMLSPLEDALSNTQAPLPPQQRQRIEVVQRNGLRLLKLVNTLLDFSRLEAGRIQAVYQPTDLATLTTELASVFRAAIEQASMELVVDCPILPEPIYVDRELWEKIIFNLISNAFKFTLEGKITVRLRWHKTKVELTVEDTGVGIPPAELPRLFDRFYRVKDSQGRSFEGSGIGLSLVRELVELHGGTIEVTSTVDRGSRFTVEIPTGSVHLPSDQIDENPTSLELASSSTNPYVQEAFSLLQQPLPPETQPQAAKPLQPSSTTSARILLADDNADMRDYLNRLLSPCYTVETVADGVAALNAVRANPPDLILSDVMMPGMDGFELLRSLRGSPETQEIPIILLSARAGEESRIEGLEAGADDYLIKPFSARELLARIEGTLKLAELRKTARSLRSQTEIAKANLQSVLTSLRDGFYTLDRNWRFVYINDRGLEIIRMQREAVIGRSIWHLFADAVDSDYYHQVYRSMAERNSSKFDYYYPAFDCWFEHRVYPVPEGIAILVADISDRKQIEQEREQLLARETSARSKAEELSRLKDEFLAIVSHELRTPLNSILGWAQLLSTGRLDPEQTAKGIAIIERNANTQAQLIEDLLDVSRILRGKIELALVPLDLANIVNSAIATVELTARAKSIPITKNFEFESNIVVLADARRLEQIVWNLLSNAIKFTPEGGKITVGLDKLDRSARIQVSDTGQGIEPDFLPYVFDRFRQADSASTRKFSGLGLGLAIVRHLTELHHGSITVESLGKDRGTTFTVELPLELKETQTDDSSPSNNFDSAKQLQGIKILAVDDEADSLYLLAFILEQAGAEVKTATSAKEAVAALSGSTFDLLISDLGMPEVDGYELMRQIRASLLSIATIPAIALSAYAGESDRQQAYDAGFQKHIAKPLEIDTIITTAIELVRR